MVRPLGFAALGAGRQIGTGRLFVRATHIAFRLGCFTLGDSHNYSPKLLLLLLIIKLLAWYGLNSVK
jgi:hypothetical protein